MNEIVKVYSHERSGTNLLCEALYQNYFSNNEKVNFKYKADINVIKKTYTRDNETANLLENPSIYLFGDHEHFAKSTARYNTKKSIYIYRNPKDTLYSLYNLTKRGLPWSEKISNNLELNSLREFLISLWYALIIKSKLRAGSMGTGLYPVKPKASSVNS